MVIFLSLTAIMSINLGQQRRIQSIHCQVYITDGSYHGSTWLALDDQWLLLPSGREASSADDTTFNWECRFRSGGLPLSCLCLCIHQKSESEVMIFNPKSITDFNQFEGTIWAKCNMMEKICQKCDFGLKEILKKNTDSTEKSNKCNQCDFASFLAGDLRTHLTMHSEESRTNATSVIMHSLRKGSWSDI